MTTTDTPDRHRDRRNDPRSTEDLISLALTETDEHAAGDAIGVLHFRGTREVLDAALQLCASDCSKERELAARILAQLGVPERAFPEEALAALTDLLHHEQDDDVLAAVASACGHYHNRRSVGALVALKEHPCEEVRFAVVMGLGCQEDDRAIEALIELSRDASSDVRDWATFGLGQQIETDTPAIREALVARLYDVDADTRSEARAGLAARREERVIEPLIAAFATGDVGLWELDAAASLGDPRLYPALLE